MVPLKIIAGKLAGVGLASAVAVGTGEGVGIGVAVAVAVGTGVGVGRSGNVKSKSGIIRKVAEIMNLSV
ncbi:MAG TPA: hypothetical protein DCF86_09135 [Dehalococcoidia bacterium]|nr:hypothetical protein [Dehalococcoidia bacterium]